MADEVWLVFQIGKRPNLVISVTVSPVIKMDHIEIRVSSYIVTQIAYALHVLCLEWYYFKICTQYIQYT